MGPAGEVWCVDLKTHEVDWKYPVKRTVLGSVAVKDDRIYFGSRDGVFHCISTDGKPLAKWNARKAIVTSPAVGREHVYFMNEGGMVFGVDAETLEPVWELSLGQGALFMSSPALGNGHLYIGSDGNGVVCAGEPSTVKRTVIWAGLRGGPGHSGYGGGGMLPLKGAKSWNYPTGEDAAVPAISAPPAYVEGAIYVGMNSEKEKGLEKILFDPKKKDPPDRKWFFPTPNQMYLSAAATSDGDVYLVDGKKGDQGRQLYCLDAEKATVKWKTPVDPDAEGTLLVTEDRVFVADKAGALACMGRRECLSGNAKVMWRAPVGDCRNAPFVVGGIAVVAASSEPHLSALDLETGAELWRTELDAAPQSDAVVAHFEIEIPKEQEADAAVDPDAPPPEPDIEMEDLVLVGSAKGVAAYDILNGGKLWDVACGSVRSVVVCSDTLAACLTDASELVLVDFTAGEEKKRIKDALPAFTPLTMGDGVLYCDKDSIQRYDLSARKSKRWMKTSWLGAITTPVVGADSHLFFATDKRGLVCARPSKR
jgi:outer membrane protein assembly factor BamB